MYLHAPPLGFRHPVQLRCSHQLGGHNVFQALVFRMVSSLDFPPSPPTYLRKDPPVGTP